MQSTCKPNRLTRNRGPELTSMQAAATCLQLSSAPRSQRLVTCSNRDVRPPNKGQVCTNRQFFSKGFCQCPPSWQGLVLPYCVHGRGTATVRWTLKCTQKHGLRQGVLPCRFVKR